MSQNQRFRLILPIIALLLLIFLTGIGTASAETWYVDDGGADFIKIKDAINTAESNSDAITTNEGTFYRVWILTNTRLMIICLLTLVLLVLVLKRIMSPEVERGIGLGLLTSGALFFVLIQTYIKIQERIKIIQFSPDLNILYYFSVIIIVIIGLIIGIFLGMAFKWSRFQIKYWSIGKKILIIFVAFNLGGICTNIIFKEPPLYIVYIYYSNISTIISIGILAVYEGVKRLWVRSRES